MALRVTQNHMYSSVNYNTNRALNALLESDLQSSSQLKINRPSDDPLGAGRVIRYRSNLNTLNRYNDNINTAVGRLSTLDSTLSAEGSIMTVLERIKQLGLQGASETYDGDNRQEIAEELRQQFMQIINIANTEFNGKHLFSGQKTDLPAYVEGLGVTSNNESLNSHTLPDGSGITFTAEGGAGKTVVIQFVEDGVFTSDGALPPGLVAPPAFRYSEDGGKTWKMVTAAIDQSLDVTSGLLKNPDDVLLNCGGVSLRMGNGVGAAVEAVASADPADPLSGPANVNETDNGTWLYVRPTAVYQGDTNGVKVVTPYGSTVSAEAQGNFARDTAVRIDRVDAGAAPPTFTYSYSTDDGGSWTQGAVSSDFSRIPVPGGYLELSGLPAAGEQYNIHPYRADITLAISDTDNITVNMVGLEIFGGIYQEPFTDKALPYGGMDNAKNMFEVVGRLTAYAETNSPDGMAQAMADLEDVMRNVVSYAAVVGGRYNRATVTQSALSLRVLDQKEQLSNTEDVDVAELMTRVSQQQMAYNSVLKTSSMIMQMGLVNYL